METEEFDELFRSAADRAGEKTPADRERLERLWKEIDGKEVHKHSLWVRILAAAAILLLLNSAWFMLGFYRLNERVEMASVVLEKESAEVRKLREQLSSREMYYLHRLDSLDHLLVKHEADTIILPPKVEYVYRERIVYRETDKAGSDEQRLDSLLNLVAAQRKLLRESKREENKVQESKADSASEYLSNASIVMERPDGREFRNIPEATPIKFNVSLFKIKNN